jgi:kynurenine formamidase
MIIHDLSMPIWPGAPYGELLPTANTSVSFTEYMHYASHGVSKSVLKIDDESGSPLMTPWQRAPHVKHPLEEGRFRLKIDEIPLDYLMLRPTAILDVQCEPRSEITAEMLREAVTSSPVQSGDDFLVRSGWGSRERALTEGLSYVIDAPSWSRGACLYMAELCERFSSRIVMTDTPLIMSAEYQGWGWSVGAERLVPTPKPWPSSEARERLLDLPVVAPHETPRPAMPAHIEKGGYRDLLRSTMAIAKCLVDAQGIQAQRVEMIILPMLVKSGGAAPCRFLAVEGRL